MNLNQKRKSFSSIDGSSSITSNGEKWKTTNYPSKFGEHVFNSSYKRGSVNQIERSGEFEFVGSFGKSLPKEEQKFFATGNECRAPLMNITNSEKLHPGLFMSNLPEEISEDFASKTYSHTNIIELPKLHLTQLLKQNQINETKKHFNETQICPQSKKFSFSNYFQQTKAAGTVFMNEKTQGERDGMELNISRKDERNAEKFYVKV